MNLTKPTNAIVRVTLSLNIPGPKLEALGITGHTEADYDRLSEWVLDNPDTAYEYASGEPDVEPDIG